MNRDELRAFRWREVAMVFQSAMNSLNPVMTVGDQIADIFTTHEGTSKKQARGARQRTAGHRPDRAGPA